MYRFTGCCYLDLCWKINGGTPLSEYKIFTREQMKCCDSCGINFDGDDTLVNKCPKCEDYCICTACRDSGSHAYHTFKLRHITLKQYMSEL